MEEIFKGQAERNGLEKIKKFNELFDFINSQKLGKDYQDTYEEAVRIAKNLVDTKSRASWDAINFENDITNKYTNVSKEFISALRRCIENYSPPVNLPSGPLWE